MRVVLHPYFSQQDKTRDLFRLDSDSGVKLYAYMAERMLDASWKPRLVLPPSYQCYGRVETNATVLTSPPLPLDNLERRLHWDTGWLKRVAQEADIVLTQHEFMAYPLRCLYPHLCIVTECGIRPDTAWPQTQSLFALSWQSSSAVACNSGQLADMVSAYARTFVWQFAYDQKLEEYRGLERTVDVLFNARASATDYSNHRLFIAAMRDMHNIFCTDPTRYLRKTECCPLRWLDEEPLSRTAYEEVLHRSRVVVGLTANGYGGYAFREAIASGAVPVALKVPEYEELLGPEWPYYCELDVCSIQRAVDRALASGWAGVPPDVAASMAVRLQQSRYQEAWKVAKADLEVLYRDRSAGRS